MGKAKTHSLEEVVNILRQIQVASANGSSLISVQLHCERLNLASIQPASNKFEVEKRRVYFAAQPALNSGPLSRMELRLPNFLEQFPSRASDAEIPRVPMPV